VSQYRLALHLTVAFLILALVVWLAFELAVPEAQNAASRGALKTVPLLIVGTIFLQVVVGAFVASLKGGLVYNTWPSMNGTLLPHDLMAIEPWYHNPFENPVMAQFNHRLIAYAVIALVAIEVWRTFVSGPRDGRKARVSAGLLLAGVLGQAALGMWTLLEAVPISLGIAHQSCAAILLILAVRHLHVSSRRG
jgi:cytochrome c oxidase assembly protein subunit 15